MKNPSRKIEEIERDVGDIAIEITQAHFVGFTMPTAWQPALNVFRCDGGFILCVELAGTEKSDVEIDAQSRRVTIRGTRSQPEPPDAETPALQVLALEIDHGPFERIVELPVEIEPVGMTVERRDGLVWIKLPLRSPG